MKRILFALMGLSSATSFLIPFFAPSSAQAKIISKTYQASSQNPPGPELRALVATPSLWSESKNRLPVWIFQPGDGSIHDQFSWITSGSLAQLLAARYGVVFVFPELRRQHFVNEPKKYCDLDFFHRVDDLHALIETVKDFPFVDSSKIYLVGHSAGSEISTIIANQRNDIRGVATYAGGLSSPGEFKPDGQPGEKDTTHPRFRFQCDDPARYWDRSGLFWVQLFTQSNLFERISESRIPYLAMVGSQDDKDFSLEAQLARRIATIKPDFEYKLIDGMGHGLGIDRRPWDLIHHWMENATPR